MQWSLWLSLYLLQTFCKFIFLFQRGGKNQQYYNEFKELKTVNCFFISFKIETVTSTVTSYFLYIELWCRCGWCRFESGLCTSMFSPITLKQQNPKNKIKGFNFFEHSGLKYFRLTCWTEWQTHSDSLSLWRIPEHIIKPQMSIQEEHHNIKSHIHHSFPALLFICTSEQMFTLFHLKFTCKHTCMCTFWHLKEVWQQCATWTDFLQCTEREKRESDRSPRNVLLSSVWSTGLLTHAVYCWDCEGSVYPVSQSLTSSLKLHGLSLSTLQKI